MDTYKYITNNYDAISLKNYLDENMVEDCYPSTTGSTISIQTEADKATLDIVMAAYLAQDNKKLAAQAEMWKLIKAERERRTLGGFYEPVSMKWFHSDSISSKQQLGLVLMGAGVPVGLQWKTMDGSFVAMTQALAGQVFAAAAANDQAVFAAAEVHKAAMLLEADPLAYDYSAGWPLTYGE